MRINEDPYKMLKVLEPSNDVELSLEVLVPVGEEKVAVHFVQVSKTGETQKYSLWIEPVQMPPSPPATSAEESAVPSSTQVSAPPAPKPQPTIRVIPKPSPTPTPTLTPSSPSTPSPRPTPTSTPTESAKTPPKPKEPAVLNGAAGVGVAQISYGDTAAGGLTEMALGIWGELRVRTWERWRLNLELRGTLVPFAISSPFRSVKTFGAALGGAYRAGNAHGAHWILEGGLHYYTMPGASGFGFQDVSGPYAKVSYFTRELPRDRWEASLRYALVSSGGFGISGLGDAEWALVAAYGFGGSWVARARYASLSLTGTLAHITIRSFELSAGFEF